MTSLITHLQNKFSDITMDKLVRDKAASSGTQLLFDFSSSYSNPNLDGLLPVGASFTNLVDGSPVAVTARLSDQSTPLINGRSSTGGIMTSEGTGSSQFINFGRSYSLHATSPSFIALAWVKCPSNAAPNAYSGIFSLQAGGVQNAMFAIDTGANGKSPRLAANIQNSAPVYRNIPGFTIDAVHQIGVAWRQGFFDIILDGKVVDTVVNTNAKLADMSGFDMTGLTGRQGTTLYRVLLEDLAAARRSVAAAAAADYASAKGRFS